MKTITFNDIKGSQLPEEWTREAEAGPDDVLEITIGPPREKMTRELLETIDRIGKNAEERGLTEEKLTELLDEA